MVNTCIKDKADFWKNKTKVANSEKNKFKRQVSRLTAKYLKAQARIKALNAENKALKADKKRLEKQLDVAAQSNVDMTTAAGHQFPLVLVFFCVQCQKYGTMSLRSTRNCVCQMVLVFGMQFKVPSHTSIRNWACKCGYHRTVNGSVLPDVEGLEWALWVDESIMMGAQKLLLILGRPIDDTAFDTAPTVKNVYVMGLKMATEWKAEAILVEIEAVAKDRKIAYIVSDKGNNLIKTYELGGFLHIPDLTHVVAKALEHIYSKLQAFTDFTTSCGLLRKKWNLSLKKCAYMPPSQRSKVRFANIFPLVEWSDKALRLINTLPETIPTDVLESFAFLGDNRAMISELLTLNQAIKTISHLLKNTGFSVENTAIVQQILAAIVVTPNTTKFVAELQKWIVTVENIRQKTGHKTVFCSSDVIESAFGKFKQKINVNSPFGMTEFVFTIANFGADYTKQEIRAALEEVKLLTLAKARPENKSIAHQKRDIFSDIKTTQS